ncbi:MAG: hypothetical protein ABF709_05075 [Leuconostoc pseudomesenteroides]|uniref:hypothetical protein n=1 Tax=Leuconostoc pseudomesenteroides TaxID=33968 RepID=UPI001E4D6695|nr:hypothetical protein [Leuconostoc pseudomesenteroides]MCC7668908.1 hypothetical protein [Leuconostoc pseudomesenteroides]
MKTKKEREYALYKGDEYLADGTISEISDATGQTIDTLLFYTTPAYHRRVSYYNKTRKSRTKGRLEMVELEDED